MSIRSMSMVLVFTLGCLAVGCVAQGDAADDEIGAVTQSADAADDEIGAVIQSGGGFTCWYNSIMSLDVVCVGSISIYSVSVTVKFVPRLDDDKMRVLQGDLNNVSVSLGTELDENKILSHVEVAVLNDFLNKFNINITTSDIVVCTTLLGGKVCK